MKFSDVTESLSSTTKRLIVYAAFLAAAVVARPAAATPLTTSMTTYPDITSSFISVNYDATADLFKADGFVSSYTDSHATTDYAYSYLFNITAAIAQDGSFSSGSLDLVNSQDPSDHLLTGRLIALGYARNDPTMQFLFDQTSGSLATVFGPQAFVYLDFSGFQNASDGFGADFGNYGDAMSDTQAPAAVPEPSTVSLLLVGAGALLLARRRSSTRIA
jgi:hypothetical protein